MVKTILVSLNNIECLPSSMLAAISLSKSFECKVIGLFVVPSIVFYSGPMGFGSGIKYFNANKYFNERAKKAKPAFENLARLHGLDAEWRQIDSEGTTVSDTIVHHGRASDLVILGHRDLDDEHHVGDVETSAYVIKGCGRPVLVVPKSAKTKFALKTVVLGWDGSREASRAIFDAVPVLRLAKKVYVTAINPKVERGVSDRSPGRKICAALKTHGIDAEIELIKTRKKIGIALLERSASADLLVIGGYGHSRLHETILGGVTERVLKTLTGPVFLSN